MSKSLRVILLTLLYCSAFSKVRSQRLFFHLGGGFINYGGDLQDKIFTLKQANSIYGGGVYYSVSNHIAIDASLSVGKLAASDAKTNTEFYRRNLSFYTRLTEGSLLIRGNLKDVPDESRFTPYLTAGFAFYHFNPYAYTFYSSKVYLQPLRTEGQGLEQYPDRKTYKLTQFAIPFGGGFTYAFSDNFMIGGELNFRKTFTDYIDDVSSKRYADTAILRATLGELSAKMSFRSDETNNPQEFNNRITRGNPDKKDAYYSCMIKLYISLNAFSSSGGGDAKRLRKQTACPVKVL